MKKHIIPLMAAAAALALNLCSCSDKNTDNYFSSEVSYNDEISSPNDAIQPFNDYFNAFISGDGEKVILATTPISYIEEMKADGTYDALLTETQDIVIKYTLAAWKEQYGDDVSFSLIEQQNSLPLSDRQLDAAVQCYKTTYGDVTSPINIIEGYEITYIYRIGGSKDSKDTVETACFVRIENDGWKMIPVTSTDLEGFNEAVNNQTAQ